MTDLKLLLDDAAGDDFTVPEQDLAADLHRGQQARRRRRLGAITGGSAATAAVAVAAWSVFPGGPVAAPPAGPAGQTATTVPAKRTSAAVPLVPNSKPFPGGLMTCSLVPKGWKAVIWHAETKQLALVGPKASDAPNTTAGQPGQPRQPVKVIVLRDSVLMGQGFEPDKYGRPWAELPRIRMGRNEAVITLGGPKNGLREIFIREGRTRRAMVINNDAPQLRWNEATLLKFAGSCRYR